MTCLVGIGCSMFIFLHSGGWVSQCNGFPLQTGAQTLDITRGLKGSLLFVSSSSFPSSNCLFTTRNWRAGLCESVSTFVDCSTVRCVRLSTEENNYVVSGNEEGQITIWQIKNNCKPVRKIPAHQGLVRCLR